MNKNEYNQYIKNYLENDKTNSAIMLTAPWGTGKSYYIEKSLLPSIEKDRCVLISLYDLKSTDEISKAIYLEIRAKKINQANEKTRAAQIFSKTIIKGITSFFGIDLSVSEEALDKLYTSIDLYDKLIILEDLERSEIDIKSILGYVYSLVEQNGAKVLLVANEDEICKIDELKNKDSESESIKNLNKEDYCRIKEKTVSDTITYTCDLNDSINNILKVYDNGILASLLNITDNEDKSILVNEIEAVMVEVNNKNLRSLIFACQKTCDMLKNLNIDFNKLFMQYVFLSIVAYSLRIKNGTKLEWGNKEEILGTSKYPLHYFSYNYINYQLINLDDIKKEEQAFVKQKEFECKQSELNEILEVLYNFYMKSEENVSVAIDKILNKLEENSVPLIEYGKLANHFIAVRDLIGCPEEIDKCKELMKSNLGSVDGNSQKLIDFLPLHDGIMLREPDQQYEYSEFMKEMQDILKNNKVDYLDFNQAIITGKDFLDLIQQKSDEILYRRSLANFISKDKFICFIAKCNSEDLHWIRLAFNSVYSHYSTNDKYYLIDLKKGVENIIDAGNISDKIVLYQLNLLKNDFQRYIDSFS